MYNCIVIDDESHSAQGLKGYIEKIPDLNLIGCFTNPLEALRFIRSNKSIDLVLLDVDMPELSGIELAKLIRNMTTKLVFTTAHTRYGYEAFEVKADGYLLKPFSLGRFFEIVNSLFPKIDNEIAAAPQLEAFEDFFFVKSKGDNLKIVKVRYSDIIAVESKLNYILIQMKDRSVLTYMSLTEISSKLTTNRGFVQFQRSFIINTDHISTIEGNMISMDNGKKITVGDYFRKDFQEFVVRLLLKAKKRK
ncbi:LytTR family DNA-binding domain-containing protein [Pedobacter sp. CFBP9032]|uniref:LytR/AlgR family response regulator transcription factor n=1 Tax=Pedobacter sp. CFBP9032 TaxID=3096539 RepID=UPI002A6B30BF|nr:LytTR family DNA-binding domain-containing protein [Pedobacter sp. CFBP9032]MDY0905123.1 LytTR family DNA-binding domain-containing protein [Pedobacter sp. CFBP9032]